MATAKEQLLSMMNPQQARLLDQQIRSKEVAQRSQGAGMLSGLVQAYTGMGDVAQRLGGVTPMGANEAGAVQAQQAQEAKQMKMAGIKQGITKVAGSSLKAADKKIIITQLAEGVIDPANVDEMLRNAQQGVATTDKFVDYIGMYAGNLDDFDANSITKANIEFRKGKQKDEDDSDMYVRVTAPLVKKLSDNTKENAQELQKASKGYASFEANLPRMLDALDNANVGLTGNFKQFMGKVIESVTGDLVDVDSVEDSELIDRFFNKEVLAAAGLMTGALTNYDIEFLKQATGTREFSREGLKEALKDLYVNKKVSYGTYKEFIGLPNKDKEVFDIEGYQQSVFGNINREASKLFGIDTNQRKQRVLLPDQDGKNKPVMSFQDFFNNKNNGG